MKLENIPIAAINWAEVPVVVQAGETGSAAARTRNLGDIQLRLIDYGVARKNRAVSFVEEYILHVIAGNLIIEHEDRN